jgi:hypothetical protein
MTTWTGKVSKTNERDWGTKVIYSWQFGGAPLWFRTNEDPKLEEGDCLRIEGQSPNKITTITHIKEEALKEAVAEQAAASSEVPPTSSPDYWRWKQMHDMERQQYYDWRDARADATRIVCAALDNEILALGATKGKRLDILIGMIRETTTQLMEK